MLPTAPVPAGRGSPALGAGADPAAWLRDEWLDHLAVVGAAAQGNVVGRALTRDDAAVVARVRAILVATGLL